MFLSLWIINVYYKYQIHEEKKEASRTIGSYPIRILASIDR